MNERELLRRAMERDGITQAELARRLGKTRQAVCMALVSDTGHSMRMAEFNRYARALGYEVELRLRRKP